MADLIKLVYSEDWRAEIDASWVRGRTRPLTGWRVRCSVHGFVARSSVYSKESTARQVGTHHRTLKHRGPRTYAFTREQLIDALRNLPPQYRRVHTAVPMADAIIGALEDET